MTTAAPIIRRPRYDSASLAAGLRWHWQGFHLSEKEDGIWQQRELCGSIIVGEAMKDGSSNAFDVVAAFGEDVRHRAWAERREALLEIVRSFTAGMSIAPEGHPPLVRGHPDRTGYRVNPQSPLGRPVAKRGRHQGHPRLNPGWATAQDRSARSHRHGAARWRRQQGVCITPRAGLLLYLSRRAGRPSSGPAVTGCTRTAARAQHTGGGALW